MSFEQPGKMEGRYPADIDMSNNATWRFAPVWLGPAVNVLNFAVSVGNVALQAQGALTDPAYGVLQAPVKQGEAGSVMTTGTTRCMVVTAITRVGMPVTLVPGGCQPATTGNFIDGYAQETGPAGAYIAVNLEKNGKA
jgi:hypothetical protein